MDYVTTASRVYHARLAQLAERTAFNRVVVGSSPTVGTAPFASRHLLTLVFQVPSSQ
jgi:hypothetical protein